MGDIFEKKGIDVKEDNLNYLKSLKPDPHVHGSELLDEGREIGKSIQAGRGGFIRSQTEFQTHIEYKEDLRRNGQIYWNILLGRPTLDLQVEGIKELYRFSQRTGLKINRIQTICSQLIGLPKELRDAAPSTTSFVMEDFEDYEAQQLAAPLDVVFQDFITTSPDGLSNTISAVRAGSNDVGVITHFSWNYPGFDNDLKQFQDTVTALGVISSKRDEGFAIASYPEDGFAAFFMDYSSLIGYVLLEHYLCNKLCDVRLSVEYGGLMSDVGMRAAIGMALKTLLTEEDNPNPVVYVNCSTTQHWDHDIEANYGITIPEMLFTILLEKKYNISLGIQPVPTTENLRVPNVDEILNIFAAGKRAEENADNWLPYMNFDPLEQTSATLIQEGRTFFQNILSGLTKAGIDVEDPLELLLVLKKFDPNRFETCFHPSTFDGANDEIIPTFPTDTKKHLEDIRIDLQNELVGKGYVNSLSGEKFVLGSADTHAYGALVLDSVLKDQGADVTFGGVDMSPVDMLDLADEIGTPYLGVSCHIGQSLDYAHQIVELSKARARDYVIFMGGRLNAVLPGDEEPVDVTELICNLGVIASNDISDIILRITNN